MSLWGWMKLCYYGFKENTHILGVRRLPILLHTFFGMQVAWRIILAFSDDASRARVLRQQVQDLTKLVAEERWEDTEYAEGRVLRCLALTLPRGLLTKELADEASARLDLLRSWHAAGLL